MPDEQPQRPQHDPEIPEPADASVPRRSGTARAGAGEAARERTDDGEAPRESPADGEATDDQAVGDEAVDVGEREWWDDPRMPWKGKPGRNDMICWGLFSFIGILSLALLPLRPLLLAHPFALSAVTGSRTAMVIIGATTSTGDQPLWWVALILATISVVKWDPIFWWAGRLWGRGLVDVIAGRSARAARNAARAERLAERWGIPAILITYVVPILPTAVIYATVGAAGMRLRTFILVDLLGSFLTRCLYMYLGYRIGQPVVDVLQVVDRYTRWIAIGVAVIVIIGVLRRGRQAPAKP